MYAELKALGLSNREVAVTLLDTERRIGDSLVIDRIDSRSLLSRTIVHVAPGEVPPTLLKDFSSSVQVLMGKSIAKMKKTRPCDASLEYEKRFSRPAAQAMQAALRAYNIDDSVYRNTLAHIANLDIAGGSDRALLYFMLFVVTGCTGNPREGARQVEQFSSSNVGAFFHTVEADVGVVEEVEDEDYNLGLMRIVGGKLKGANGFYKLDASDRGTEIGSLTAEAHAINDVDEDVSRHHARIYKQGSHWYIIGLKSTNGTTVISGEDKMEHVVEPPRRERGRDYVPEPYEIFPTDTICLGSSTRFMVLPVMDD